MENLSSKDRIALLAADIVDKGKKLKELRKGPPISQKIFDQTKGSDGARIRASNIPPRKAK